MLIYYLWKYLFIADPIASFLSIASKLPIPLYFFSLTPSEKKYSPGASDVPANNEPIITNAKKRQYDFFLNYKIIPVDAPKESAFMI